MNGNTGQSYHCENGDVAARFFERNRLRDKTVFEFAFYEHALIFYKLG